MHTNWCVLIEISMEIGMLNFWLPLLVTALTKENYFRGKIVNNLLMSLKWMVPCSSFILFKKARCFKKPSRHFWNFWNMPNVLDILENLPLKVLSPSFTAIWWIYIKRLTRPFLWAILDHIGAFHARIVQISTS